MKTTKFSSPEIPPGPGPPSPAPWDERGMRQRHKYREPWLPHQPFTASGLMVTQALDQLIEVVRAIVEEKSLDNGQSTPPMEPGIAYLLATAVIFLQDWNQNLLKACDKCDSQFCNFVHVISHCFQAHILLCVIVINASTLTHQFIQSEESSGIFFIFAISVGFILYLRHCYLGRYGVVMALVNILGVIIVGQIVGVFALLLSHGPIIVFKEYFGVKHLKYG